MCHLRSRPRIGKIFYILPSFKVFRKISFYDFHFENLTLNVNQEKLFISNFLLIKAFYFWLILLSTSFFLKYAQEAYKWEFFWPFSQ